MKKLFSTLTLAISLLSGAANAAIVSPPACGNNCPWVKVSPPACGNNCPWVKVSPPACGNNCPWER